MFIDELTQNKIHANLDESVIHGTLRNCDIIPALCDVIQDTPAYLQLLASSGSPIHAAMNRMEDKSDDWWNSEEATDLCQELFEVCDKYAPEGYYFGAHPGDGSDFGYWKTDY